MIMVTAASGIANVPLLPAGLVGHSRGRVGNYGSGSTRVFVNKSVVHCEMRPLGLGSRLPFESSKSVRSVAGSSRMKSASVICASALNARCSSAEGQTQTIIRESPTITHLPGKEKSPSLDDGGTGFPPRDDGGGGGGGGWRWRKLVWRLCLLWISSFPKFFKG